MALEPLAGVSNVTVNYDDRTVAVIHDSEPQAILEVLLPLRLGVQLLESEGHRGAEMEERASSDQGEARVLKQLLAINAAMFVVELVVGLLADSTGLLADSLDMLADAGVYSISLWAVGRGLRAQYRASRISGFAQVALAGWIFFEVARRALLGSEPESLAMMGMSAVALGANVACVWLLRRHRDRGVHMQASWIFSTNDALANLGVILAGALVLTTGSAVPDLVVGTVIAGLVGRGALRILRLPAPPV